MVEEISDTIIKKIKEIVKDENEQKFYLRTGPSTIELTDHEMQQFISQRFRNN